MKFDTPATTNPIDRTRVVGRSTRRIDGPLKVTGRAPYVLDRHDVAADQAHGCIVGAAIATGRIESINLLRARYAPGVLAIVTHRNAGALGQADRNNARLLGGPEIQHYHQAVALVVAESFEQARAAARLVEITYAPTEGSFDLAAARSTAKQPDEINGGPPDTAVGDFAEAYAAAPVQLDATYTTAPESHAMMEPHASIAAWDGDQLTVWTSTQMVDWCATDLAETLQIPKENIRVDSPYIGGGFGSKLFVRADALLAALGARAAGRPVRVALPRPLIFNNTTHRAGTIQRLRLGAGHDGRLTAIAHETWSGDIGAVSAEAGVLPTRLLYAGAHRLTATRVAALNLSEANAMRAPGETPGLMALEIAMDEMAENVGLDPVAFRITNDTQVDPEHPERPFSQREFVACLRRGAQEFGWDQRNPRPAQTRDGRWLIGLGVAGAIRGTPVMASGARVRLDREGIVTVETDMTDIGTGSYTILAQTAAEMMGVPLDHVRVELGDSRYPASCGSGGQWGANSSTAGVYAACVKLRETVARLLGLDPHQAEFADEQVSAGGRRVALRDAVRDQDLVAEDTIEFGELSEKHDLSAFGAQFVEVGVDAATGEIRLRRMLAVCSAGRILNPKSARSQVLGGMTMGAGAALMEELQVDTGRGYFVNHDLAGYELPVHADIPHQDVILLEAADPYTSPMKAKGIAELGICGVGAAVANAIYHATGIRVRDYPITLDKLIDHLPDPA